MLQRTFCKKRSDEEYIGYTLKEHLVTTNNFPAICKSSVTTCIQLQRAQVLSEIGYQ